MINHVYDKSETVHFATVFLASGTATQVGLFLVVLFARVSFLEVKMLGLALFSCTHSLKKKPGSVVRPKKT
jgi:hypothetical protein